MSEITGLELILAMGAMSWAGYVLGALHERQCRERIEARRVETTQIGSIHESRAEGLAQTPHSQCSKPREDK